MVKGKHEVWEYPTFSTAAKYLSLLATAPAAATTAHEAYKIRYSRLSSTAYICDLV